MRGITLIEVLVVIVIFSILATIAIPAFNNWRIRISIESDVKDIYAFVQKARAIAFSEKKDITIQVNGTNICMFEGTTQIGCIDLNNPFIGTVEVSSRGYFSTIGSIRYTGGATVNRNYDCIAISINRVRMGVWNGTTCQVK